MSVSTEVQRTLVKSPPELWSELSNPDALARHLSELGEIRITAVEPETKVEWEAEGVSGIVQLKQSGWGTKVTLSVTRAAPAGEEPPPEPETIAEPADAETKPGTAEPASEPVAVEPESSLLRAAHQRAGGRRPTRAGAVSEPEPEPIAAVEPEPEPSQQSSPSRTGRSRRARAGARHRVASHNSGSLRACFAVVGND